MKNWFCLLALIMLTSCYDDFDNSTTEVIEEKPRTIITTDINGKAIAPGIEDYSRLRLEFNGQSVPLKDSLFYFNASGLNKEGQLFYLYLDDRLYGLASFPLIENAVNYIEIGPAGTWQTEVISAGQDAELTLNSDVLLSIGSERVTAAGEPLSASATMEYLGFSDSESRTTLPDSYLDEDGRRERLEATDLAFMCRLSNGDGEEAYSAFGGSHIIIRNPVQNSHLYKVLGNGSLHRLEPVDGRYSFDGNGFYIYATSVPAEMIESRMTYDNLPVPFARLELDGKPVYTTQSGQWIAQLEEGAVANAVVRNPCGDTVQEWLIDPSGFNRQTGLVLEEQNELAAVDIEVLGCQAGMIQPALILEHMEGDQLMVFREEPIKVAFLACDASFGIRGFDLENGSKGPLLEWRTALDDIIRYLSACASDDTGFSYISIDGIEKRYEPFEVREMDGETVLESQDGRVLFRFDGTDEGVVNEESVNLYINDPGFGAEGFSISCQNSPLGCGIDYFNVTHYEDSGWFRVSFAGRIWAQTLQPAVASYYPIEGVIMRKRD